MRQTGIGRDFCRHLVQFESAQRVQEVALQDDALALPLCQAFLDQMLGTGFHGVAGLATEPAHGERHGVAFDQPVVKPGCSFSRDLPTEIKIGTGR